MSRATIAKTRLTAHIVGPLINNRHANNGRMNTQTMDGVAIQLHARETLASNAAVLRAQEQIFDLLVRQLQVSVTVTGLDESAHVESLFKQVCALLASAANNAGSPAECLSLAVDAAQLSPQQLWSERCDSLGPGPLYLLVNSELMRPSANADERRLQDRFWMQCWLLRSNVLVRTALAPIVSSSCPLFAMEHACGILPPRGLQVPPGTAWAAMRINLMDYVDEHGEVSVFALRESVRRCIEYGEQVHNDTAWPNAAMRHDGWSNRRLAISIDGIGDLVRARKADPQRFTVLQALGEIFNDIRDEANQHSRRLATENEHAPSLKISESDEQASGIVELADWQAQWRAALQFTATRHRNLLALSPWSLFPAGESADSRYSDLLPLLAHADVCSFPAPPCLNAWNINEFKHFHHRAWAVLEQKDAQQMIAEQV